MINNLGMNGVGYLYSQLFFLFNAFWHCFCFIELILHFIITEIDSLRKEGKRYNIFTKKNMFSQWNNNFWVQAQLMFRTSICKIKIVMNLLIKAQYPKIYRKELVIQQMSKKCHIKIVYV